MGITQTLEVELQGKSFRLRESEYKALKTVLGFQGISLKDFYQSAFEEMTEVREDWSGEIDLDRFPWNISPADGKKVMAHAPLEVVAPLDAYAERDGVRITDVIYTATFRKLRELIQASELLNVFGTGR